MVVATRCNVLGGHPCLRSVPWDVSDGRAHSWTPTLAGLDGYLRPQEVALEGLLANLDCVCQWGENLFTFSSNFQLKILNYEILDMAGKCGAVAS